MPEVLELIATDSYELYFLDVQRSVAVSFHLPHVSCGFLHLLHTVESLI